MGIRFILRLAVVGDIHGNFDALQAVLVDLRRFSVDGIIVAGDWVGCLDANEMFDLLRGRPG